MSEPLSFPPRFAVGDVVRRRESIGRVLARVARTDRGLRTWLYQVERYDVHWGWVTSYYEGDLVPVLFGIYLEV